MKRPFNHADMQNIKNYSGQNESYTNNIPKILFELDMQEELEKFDDAKKWGTFDIVDEIMDLVTNYPAVKERFGKQSLDIIAALYFKGNTGSLNINIGDSENQFELQDITEDEKTPGPYEEARMNELAAELPILSKQLREHCIALFEKEFEGESQYINYIKGKDFLALCDELAVYNEKGARNIDSTLFTQYRKISGMTDDRIIGPIHTRFAVKIRHIFENMKENPEIRRIHDESRL